MTESDSTSPQSNASHGVAVQRLVRCPDCRGKGYHIQCGPCPNYHQWSRWTEECKTCKGEKQIPNPFLECVFKHERTLKEKCPMSKKNVDELPNGHYTSGEMKTKGYTAERPWRLTRNDGKVEAERYRKCEGSSFSGWIVRSTTDQFSYSDPIPNKASAIKHLLEWKA